MKSKLITLDQLDQLNHILDDELYDELVLLKQSILCIQNKKKKRLYKCNKCDYTATHSSNLTSHYRLMHTSEKPWKCSICTKTFGRSDYLRKHMRCHTGEKPHICNICNKAFRQKSALSSHVKRLHS